MVLTHSRAELIATVVETMFYGIYFVLFLRCLQVSWQRHVEGALAVLLLATSLLLFSLITIHMCVTTWRNLDAFVGPHAEVMSNAAEAFFAQHVFDRIDRLKNILNVLYRCCMVYERRWTWLCLPGIIFLGDVGYGVFGIYSLCTHKGMPDPVKSKIVAYTKYFYVVNMTLNVVCTVMIATRILLVQRRSSRSGLADTLRTLNKTVVIIVESAAIYSVALVVLIIFIAEQSGGVYTVMQVLPTIIGIVFSLIIVRVGGGRDQATSLTVFEKTCQSDTVGSVCLRELPATRRGTTVTTTTATYAKSGEFPSTSHGCVGGVDMSIALHRCSTPAYRGNDLERGSLRNNKGLPAASDCAERTAV
ncbi:hypothetical protein HDZ31DRAFT_30112 [Schizophyllum fasciatum]